jgi:hypothetical protein
MFIVGFAIANSLHFQGNDDTLKTRIIAGSPPKDDDPEETAYQIYFSKGETYIEARNASLYEAFSCEAIYPDMVRCFVKVGEDPDDLPTEKYEKYFK